MNRKIPVFASVDRYICSYPGELRKKLRELRKFIKKRAPGARERISYGIPAFFLKRNLVYFAGFSKHIGFYPGARAVEAFKNQLSKFKHAKGSIQLPADGPLPFGLIGKILEFKIAEDMKKTR